MPSPRRRRPGGENGVFGQAESTNSNWTVNDTDPCDAPRRFYCFGNTVVIFWDRFEAQDPSRWSGNVGFAP